MKNKMIAVSSFLFLMLLFLTTTAQRTSIQRIMANPGAFQDEVVQVDGLVTNYVPASANSTAYYMLKGDFGDMIRVNTATTAPETNKKCCVNGILYCIKDNEGLITRVFISEQERYDGICDDKPIIALAQEEISFKDVKIDNGVKQVLTINNTGKANLNLLEISLSNKEVFELVMPQSMVVVPGANAEVGIIFTPGKEGKFSGILTIKHNAENGLSTINVLGETVIIPWWKKPAFIIMILAGILLLVLIIVLLLRRKQSNIYQPSPSTISSLPGKDPITANSPAREDLKTIIIPMTIPKTVRVFPGEFEIVAGLDKGKKFKMPGYQTNDGLRITIGREKVNGELGQFHIELKDTTVGRKQAEIYFTNNIAYLKSLGETNHSLVDGQDILPGNTVELKPNAVMQFGDVSLVYKY
jgi:hypothetical protein